MAIPFKRMGRKDPRKVDGVVKYQEVSVSGKCSNLSGEISIATESGDSGKQWMQEKR